MVTVSDADKRLSESVSVRVTVGEDWEYKNPVERQKTMIYLKFKDTLFLKIKFIRYSIKLIVFYYLNSQLF